MGERQPKGGLIVHVEPGSSAHKAGLRAGDRVVAVNGNPVWDIIDFRYHSNTECVALHVLRGETSFTVNLRQRYGDTLGIRFENPLFDGIRTCNNQCPFCFVDRMPKGRRRSLYIRDDDYRLSFLFGDFITLTNLKDEDWKRIVEQRLSPLYVSVHSTDLELRRRLLGNPHAPDIVDQLRWLGEHGIQTHTQVVVCPGINDGNALDKTISDLASLYPHVLSIGIVPVGLATPRIQRHHRWLEGAIDHLRPHTVEECRAIIDRVEPWRRSFRAKWGISFVYPSDEYYLAAARPIPPARQYDGFPQLENGIGMVRKLLDDWIRVRRRLTPSLSPIKALAISGKLIEPKLRPMVEESALFTGCHIDLVALENSFFGGNVSVSGLLTGGLLLEGLRRQVGHYDLMFLPRVMLDSEGERFLDDLTPAQVEAELGIPICFVEKMSDVARALKIALLPSMAPQG